MKKEEKVIKDDLFNLLYSLKFLVVNKTKINIFRETEYKSGFVLNILAQLSFLLVSYLSAIFVSDFLGLDKVETLFIMFSSYLFWDLASPFMVSSLFKKYWLYSLFPLDERITVLSGYYLRRFFYYFVEVSIVLYLAVILFGKSWMILIKLFVFTIILSLILSLLINNTYLVGTILFRKDSYVFNDLIGQLQYFFSKYNPKYIKEFWLKLLLFIFMVPFYTYLIVDALKGNFLYYLIKFLVVLVLEIIIYISLMKIFKKIYENYGG